MSDYQGIFKTNYLLTSTVNQYPMMKLTKRIRAQQEIEEQQEVLKFQLETQQVRQRVLTYYIRVFNCSTNMMLKRDMISTPGG